MIIYIVTGQVLSYRLLLTGPHIILGNVIFRIAAIEILGIEEEVILLMEVDYPGSDINQS